MFKFGAIKSPADPRDFIYSQIMTVGDLPERFMLPELPVRNQGKFGTCVGFAAAGVKDIQESLNYPSRGVQTSPLFVYSECKKLDGIPDTEGTHPRVAMKVLKDIGICRENSFPYQTMTSKTPPATPTNAINEAGQFKVGAYAKIQTIAEIKQAIVSGSPVLGGLIVCENCIYSEDGFLPLPDGGFLGGHAIALTGWDDNLTHTYANGKTVRGFLRLRNSWDNTWGDSGYAWLPYDFVTFRDSDIGMTFFTEAWSSVDIILPPEEAKEVILWVDKVLAVVDGQRVVLDQPPTIDPRSNRTLVPLRFLADVLNYKVQWFEAERKIVLSK